MEEDHTSYLSPQTLHRERQQLDNGYAAILHILHTVLVHHFFLLITVINTADLRRHHTGHFHQLTGAIHFQRSLGIAHFHSLYSWCQVIRPAGLWPIGNVWQKTLEGCSPWFRLTAQVTGTGYKPEIYCWSCYCFNTKITMFTTQRQPLKRVAVRLVCRRNKWP